MRRWFWILLVALSGCAGVNDRIQKDPAEFAALPESDRALIRRGEIAKGFTEQEVSFAKGEPTSKQTRWKNDEELTIWTYTRSSVEQAPSAPGGDSMSAPFGYPVPGPQPLQTQPIVTGETTWLIVKFVAGHVTEWQEPQR